MKQHFIPRLYLRRFSNDGRSIYTYDKKQAKSFRTSIMSVCCINNLYSISESFINDYCLENETSGYAIKKLSIEDDYFANNIEPMFGKYLKQLDDIKQEWTGGQDKYRLNYEEKKELALHITTQYFRLPYVMDSLVNNHLRLEKADVDSMKRIISAETGDKTFEDLQIDITCEKPVLHAQISYLNVELLMQLGDILAGNIYVFWISQSSAFYTSDFPIVLNPHVKNVSPSCFGLAQYGGELMMTLSPNLALSIYDRNYFKEKEKTDACFVVADDKEVRRRNWINYLYATQNVFCLKNDFEIIKIIHSQKGKHMFFSPNLQIKDEFI